MIMKRCLLVMAIATLMPVLSWAGPAVGSPAPDFNIPDTAWVNHHLTEWRGKTVQLLFWSST